jgi:hypothetical protein
MKQVLFIVCIFFFQFKLNAQVSTLNRPNDPIVLTGSQLTSFSNLTPGQIVGFKFVNGAWIQIPIQVDERALLDIMTPYGPNANGGNYVPSPNNPKVTFYCDPTTYTGADPNTNFDSDDELVFMAKDAGGPSNGASPSGIICGTCKEIAINDPLGGTGYIYLFQNGGTLQQNAGTSYVNYSSNLTSTSGFPSNTNGANIENTTITTSKYIWHFSAEWVSDKMQLIVGNNSDLLDRYKNFFANGNCLRNEDSFSAGENAYVCVKSGPIRVIRSYMGANSGPLTARTHLFYERRQDISTDLRVHNIVSVFDAFDYSPAAFGMAYRNNLNPSGVIIDGQTDTVNIGVLNWEQISGTQGTISIVHRTITNMTSTDGYLLSYYNDNAANPASNCTGDGQAWGTSGVGIHFNNGTVCTDPLNGCAVVGLRYITTKRTIYIDAPNGSSTTASNYDNKLNNSLSVSISSCQITSGSCSGPTLYGKLFLEGYYSGAGSNIMNNVTTPPMGGLLYHLGTSTNPDDVDYVTLSAMNEYPPYALIESQIGILKRDGTIQATFSTAILSTGHYYIRITHRNALESWSASPVVFGSTSSNLRYDFTTAASKAYGNNQSNLLDGNWAIYSGDISDANTGNTGFQDGVMESQDYVDVENAVYFTYVGYIIEDLTGDGIVESGDYSLMENNLYYTRVVVRP